MDPAPMEHVGLPSFLLSSCIWSKRALICKKSKTLTYINIINYNLPLNSDAEYITSSSITYLSINMVVTTLSLLLWDIAPRREQWRLFAGPGKEKRKSMDEISTPRMCGIFGYFFCVLLMSHIENSPNPTIYTKNPSQM